MPRIRRWSYAVPLIVASLAQVGAAGRQATLAQKPARATDGVTPRAADGHPDLEGVWENNSATPLERPPQFANKPRLSDGELADLKRRASRLFGPDTEAVFGDALYLALLDDF